MGMRPDRMARNMLWEFPGGSLHRILYSKGDNSDGLHVLALLTVDGKDFPVCGWEAGKPGLGCSKESKEVFEKAKAEVLKVEKTTFDNEMYPALLEMQHDDFCAHMVRVLSALDPNDQSTLRNGQIYNMPGWFLSGLLRARLEEIEGQSLDLTVSDVQSALEEDMKRKESRVEEAEKLREDEGRIRRIALQAQLEKEATDNNKKKGLFTRS